ncbi:MAG TPA: thioredoxin domain-containing protein [Polyangiaceae bacterium]|nr:thioredoxin domain-containing protein [Polyangiaceae bacterium]
MPNHLIHETSQYLRQHAENPVDWYAWGEHAFARARQEDKPIHLSIGYAACHWCHVMAHESFEDPKVAAVMNERFVNIKVDRQERPDVDDVYQKVVQMMGISGGWPLTIFMTPSGEPFYGGTYFPPRDAYGRPSFVQLITQLSDAWAHQRDQLVHNVEQFKQGFRSTDEPRGEAGLPAEEDVPAEAALFFAENTDPTHGGLRGAPKFPNPSCLDLMLRVHERNRDSSLFRALEVTLDQMARGGIYDHLGGGFARYSVDERWAVPHFEKMLYDNGQLTKLYADAYRLTGKPEWRRIVVETVGYVLRDMTHPFGGFFSSEDADSEGEEGKFYVFTLSELKAILGETEAEFAARAFGVTAEGNFEHGATVLHRPVNLDATELHRLERVRERLLSARNTRPRPARDENILTSWNALMLQGLCAAYQATGIDDYLAAAIRNAGFIQTHLTTSEGGLYRAWRDGTAKIRGFLDDYAFLCNALLDLYESSFDRSYLSWARHLVDVILTRFWDGELYFTPSDGERLVHRPRAPHDNAWPSGVSTTLFALVRLHELTQEARYQEHAESLLRAYGAAATRSPFGFAHFLAAVDFVQRGPLQIVLAGDRPKTAALASVVLRQYLPARVLAHAEDVTLGEDRTALDGKATAYVCRQGTCNLPVTNADALLEQCRTQAERR